MFNTHRAYQNGYLSKNLVSHYASLGQTTSQASSEKTMSYLNIYYENLYYTIVKESPLMTPASLLGTIG